MRTTRPATQDLPLGVVDKTTSHFVLCYGTQDDPKEWTPIAWLGGTDDVPVAEIAPGLDADTRQRVERELRIRVAVDPEFTTYVGTIVDGVPRPSWWGSLACHVGSTSNWYGDMHWRHVRGA